jgi:uncharacterized protein YrrD
MKPMLYEAKTLNGYKLNGLDGEFGHVKDFYFDDRHWVVRYLLADTGSWLTSRQVLISPYAMRSALESAHHIDISLTKKQIEDSPSLDSDKPVSLQYETDYHNYYGWPIYWGGPNVWGYYPYMWGSSPYSLPTPQSVVEAAHKEEHWNPHLRSCREVDGYHVHATDGEIGHITDFILDDATWAIRYLIAETSNWWPERKVLISPHWIEHVSWAEAFVSVNLSRDTLKHSIEYTGGAQLNQEFERALSDCYGSEGLWSERTPGATIACGIKEHECAEKQEIEHAGHAR